MSSPSSWQLAQLNIARAVAPLTSPVLADFVAALDQINALADTATTPYARPSSSRNDPAGRDTPRPAHVIRPFSLRPASRRIGHGRLQRGRGRRDSDTGVGSTPLRRPSISTISGDPTALTAAAGGLEPRSMTRGRDGTNPGTGGRSPGRDGRIGRCSSGWSSQMVGLGWISPSTCGRMTRGHRARWDPQSVRHELTPSRGWVVATCRRGRSGDEGPAVQGLWS